MNKDASTGEASTDEASSGEAEQTSGLGAADAGLLSSASAPEAGADVGASGDSGPNSPPLPPTVPPERHATEWTALMASDAHDIALGVATDTSGNAIVVGYTEGIIGAQNHGRGDAFVGSFLADGTRNWLVQIGGAENDWANAVAVSAEDEIIVAGKSNSTEGTTFDATVTKLAGADGEVLWEEFVVGDGSDVAHSVAVASTGRIAIGGSTTSTLSRASAGGNDLFVGELSAEGQWLWLLQAGTKGNDEVLGVAIDDEGGLVAVGHTAGALFGESNGGADAFVAKYSGEGVLLWSLQFGTPADDEVRDVVQLPDGGMAIVGTTSGELGTNPVGGRDAFVARLTAAGELLWTHQYGSATSDLGRAIAQDTDGTLVIAGLSFGLTDSAPDFSEVVLDDSEVFLSGIDQDGTRLWGWQGGGFETDDPNDLAIDSAGEIFVVGGASRRVASDATDSDAFLLRLPER